MFELGSRFVVPSLRRKIVEVLYKDYKLNQVEIAKLLHITQSAVSRYLGGGRGKLIDISKYEDIANDLKVFVKTILDKRLSSIEIQRELIRLSLKMFSRKYLCDIHREKDPSIDIHKCNICPEMFSKII